VRKTLKDVPVLLWFVQLLKASVNINDIGSIVSVLSNPVFGEELTAKEARKITQGKSKKASMLYGKILAFGSWAASIKNASELYSYYDIDCHISPTSMRYAEYKRHIMNLLNKFQAYIDRKTASIADGLIEFINSSSLYGVDVLKEDIHITENTVKLMTLHACKGLEFRYVFIIGANYGLIPVISADEDEKEDGGRNDPSTHRSGCDDEIHRRSLPAGWPTLAPEMVPCTSSGNRMTELSYGPCGLRSSATGSR
jgi:DNA helicase-2/ATP-dependent DNA helicase PcrA